MFIGGASGSTAGGIKVNTFSVLLIAIVSTVRGRAVGRGLRPPDSARRRLPGAVRGAPVDCRSSSSSRFGLELLAGIRFVDIDVRGRSRHSGPSASATGHHAASCRTRRGCSLVAAMFAGRLGPLTLVLALAARARTVSYRPAVETMRIG